MSKINLLQLKKYLTHINLISFCLVLSIYIGLMVFKDTFASLLILNTPRTFFSLFLPVLFTTGISMFISFHALSAYDKYRCSQSTTLKS